MMSLAYEVLVEERQTSLRHEAVARQDHRRSALRALIAARRERVGSREIQDG